MLFYVVLKYYVFMFVSMSKKEKKRRLGSRDHMGMDIRLDRCKFRYSLS